MMLSVWTKKLINVGSIKALGDWLRFVVGSLLLGCPEKYSWNEPMYM